MGRHAWHGPRWRQRHRRLPVLCFTGTDLFADCDEHTGEKYSSRHQKDYGTLRLQDFCSIVLKCLDFFKVFNSAPYSTHGWTHAPQLKINTSLLKMPFFSWVWTPIIGQQWTSFSYGAAWPVILPSHSQCTATACFSSLPLRSPSSVSRFSSFMEAEKLKVPSHFHLPTPLTLLLCNSDCWSDAFGNPGTARNSLNQPNVWLTIFLTSLLCILPVVAFRFILIQLRPTINDKVRREERTHDTDCKTILSFMHTVFKVNMFWMMKYGLSALKITIWPFVMLNTYEGYHQSSKNKTGGWYWSLFQPSFLPFYLDSLQVSVIITFILAKSSMSYMINMAS